MEYDKNGQILREFYARHDLTDCFERDNTYLESAFDEINRIWFDNLYKIDEVNYLMIAEAPLWGKSKSYIYNPATPFTLNINAMQKAERNMVGLDCLHEFVIIAVAKCIRKEDNPFCL